MKNTYSSPPQRGFLWAIVLYCIFSMVARPLAAQTVLFSKVSPGSLTTSQQKVVDYVSNLPYEDGFIYATVDDLASTQDNGFLAVTIPTLDTGTYFFYAEHVTYKNASSYTWVGKIKAGYGDFALFSNSTGKGGFIDLGTKFFSIHPLGGDLVVIVRHDMTEYPLAICGGGGERDSETAYCEEDDCGAAIVDILVLVTPDAEDWLADQYGGFDQFYVWLGTEYINSALVLSGVANKRARIRVEWGYEPFTQLIPTNIKNGIDNLEFHQELSGSLKFQYRADIVVMLTDVGFVDQNGISISGVANSLDPDAAEKYCIVEIQGLLEPRFNFLHEVGHQFGCDHDPGNTLGDEEFCAHGHLLDLDGPALRPTLMGLTAATETDDPTARILRYSNPDIEFAGEPTGVVDERDNARILRASFCSVAANQPAPELGVVIEGGPVLCLPSGEISGSNTWAASIIAPGTGFPGVAPYSYAWYWSADGILNTGNYLGSGASVTVTQAYNCPAMWLHVVVTSDDDVVAYADKKIWTVLCEDCSAPRSSVMTNQTVVIVPNPSNGETALQITGIDPATFTVQLLNQQGRLMRSVAVNGSENLSVDIAGLPAGLYFLAVIAQREVGVQKVVIQK